MLVQIMSDLGDQETKSESERNLPGTHCQICQEGQSHEARIRRISHTQIGMYLADKCVIPLCMEDIECTCGPSTSCSGILQEQTFTPSGFGSSPLFLKISSSRSQRVTWSAEALPVFPACFQDVEQTLSYMPHMP